MKFKTYGPGDVIEGWRFALLPKRCISQSTGEYSYIWLGRYYEYKKCYKGGICDFWDIKRYSDYDPDRVRKITQHKKGSHNA